MKGLKLIEAKQSSQSSREIEAIHSPFKLLWIVSSNGPRVY